MKKTNASNPLKFFNDNKAMAYKKAGGEMAAFKKSLLKANNGRIVKNKMGPMTEMEAAQAAFASPQNDPALPPIPYAIPQKPKTTKGLVAGQEMEFTPEQMKSIFGIQKRGGSVGRKK